MCFALRTQGERHLKALLAKAKPDRNAVAFMTEDLELFKNVSQLRPENLEKLTSLALRGIMKSCWTTINVKLPLTRHLRLMALTFHQDVFVQVPDGF